MPIEDTVKNVVRRILSSRIVMRAPLFLRTVIQLVGKFVIRAMDRRLHHRPRAYPIYVPSRPSGQRPLRH